MEQNKRVLVGFSGGIDSTAVCLLLREQGYEPIGVTMQVWGDIPEEAAEGAKKLNLEHYIADERKEFKKIIVDNFINEYKKGRTPNPCVNCNPLFKFRVLLEYADKLNCSYIATGHYSLVEQKNDNYYLVAGNDIHKDQSYFLWALGQEVLSRCLFPLGNMTKPDVRAYLETKGFHKKASGGESMEVCFIKGDYRDFLKEHYPSIDAEIGKGYYVNKEGKKLGEHQGFAYYTIGQRKGLNIALGEPAYVLKINADKNTVMLGKAEDLRAEYMLVENDCLIDEMEVIGAENITVRIRYKSRPVRCDVRRLSDGRLLVKFYDEASAITPGQSAVFYDGKRVLGGGFIANQKGINWIVEQNKDIFR